MTLYSHLKNIGRIPVKVVDEHQEVLHFWRTHRLENIVLLHIDAHADMDGYIPPRWYNPHDRGIASFISRAAHEKIVSSVFWLNPHLVKDQVRYWRVSGKTRTGEDEQVKWQGLGTGRIIRKKDAMIRTPYVLDIDLDAFCCHRPVESARLSYQGVIDYEKRIDRTMAFLKALTALPVAIDIARSQREDDRKYCFVPPEKVDDVQRYVIGRLIDLYGPQNP